MADDSSNNGLRWWTALGTAITVLAFLGVHNAAQLNSVFNHASAAPSASAPQSAPAAPVPAPPVATCHLYCHVAHFDVTSKGSDGVCTRTGCPVTGTFTNNGHALGWASVEFFLNGPAPGSCFATIPVTAPGDTSTAGCYAFTIGSAPAYVEEESINPIITQPVG
ncbi:hypothetical protein ACIBCO_28855 [Streptomyces violascens]|uniref:hypothetical protein n=1 Tax=Streptomyces violascens TaxID=67381 RepID=UPI00379FB82D